MRVITYPGTVIVTGQLDRTRDFNGSILDDRWRYTKTYSRQGGRWQLVAYHASESTK